MQTPTWANPPVTIVVMWSRGIMGALGLLFIHSTMPVIGVAQDRHPEGHSPSAAISASADAQREGDSGVADVLPVTLGGSVFALEMARSPAQPVGATRETFCVAPSAPFRGPPTAPYCSLSGSGYNACSSWQIDDFKDDVEDYIDDMQQYLSEAEAYASCQVKRAVANWNNFASGY